MIRYYLESIARKYVKEYGILPFGRNLSQEYGKQLLNTTTKTRVDALRTSSEKALYKAGEETRDVIGKKS